MSDKELSHQDSALLFINTLQDELAKTNATTQAQRHHPEPLKRAPPTQQIRRLQIPKGESQSKGALQPQGTSAHYRPGSKNPERR
jgi:hypothetical protein